ncbi:MAG: glycoside hydrolase family 16 protein [Clostridia bacterium]|nr:glycoside hydrolase family 16 protein [Clostridia bacterium]
MDFFQTLIALFAALCSMLFGMSFPLLENKTADMDKFELVWSDEFDSDTLDTAKWQGCNHAPGQTVVRKGGYWNMDMVSVRDGNLHIAAKYYEDGYLGNGKAGWYTGAVFTKDLYEQTHGYFEIRCILPTGSGLWSAFWMNSTTMAQVGNGGTDGAEIDIFESAYYSTAFKNRVSSAVHYDGYGDDLQSTTVAKPFILNNDPYKEFNTYGLEWNENEYIFYINGVETGRSNFGGTSLVPEYLILSVEIGGADGVAADSWAGKALDKNFTPTDFIVDYVRAYQYK